MNLAINATPTGGLFASGVSASGSFTIAALSGGGGSVALREWKGWCRCHRHRSAQPMQPMVVWLGDGALRLPALHSLSQVEDTAADRRPPAHISAIYRR